MNEEAHAALASARTRGSRPSLKAVSIDVRLAGPLLDVTAEQSYRNDSRQDIEVVYTFPLPPRATLMGLEFELGERRLAGAVRSKSQAEDAYERAVAAGDAAVLVEQERDGRFTANLGNLKPGERARIRLRYGQLIEAAGAHWRVAIPTVLAPLYGDPHADGGLAAHKRPLHSTMVEYPLQVTVTVQGGARVEDVSCPSHEVDLADSPAGVRVVTRGGAYLDRDFVLLIKRKADALAIAAPDVDGAVAIASVVVPDRPAQPAPVAMRIALDCSGSMAGESMDWATVACQQLVANLGGADAFSITRFGSGHEHWRPELMPANDAHKRIARDWLFDVAADLGGTEMHAALKAAAALPGRSSHSDLVLITDGDISATDALVRWARGARLRIHVVGVGASPNAAFLQELARATAGRCELVTPGEDLVGAVERVLAAARAAHVQKLVVTWPRPPRWHLQWPAVATSGETVHCFAGFDGAVRGAVSITSDGVDAHVPLTFVDGPVLGRVATLERIRSGHFDDPAAAAERYQLVTEWTSLIAVAVRDADNKAGGLPELAPVEHMMAAGWGGYGRAQEARSLGAADVQFCMARAYDDWSQSVRGASERRGTFSGRLRARIEALLPWTGEAQAARKARRDAVLAAQRERLCKALARLNRRVFADRVLGATSAWSLEALRAVGIPSVLLDRIAKLLRKGIDEALACCALVAALGRRFGEDAASVRAAQAWLTQYDNRGEAARTDAKGCEKLVAQCLDEYLHNLQ